MNDNLTISTLQLSQAADEIKRLRAALKTAQQALIEFSHAQESGPNWYTHGKDGMYRQVHMWLRKGLEAVREALGPYDENGRYLKERHEPSVNDSATKNKVACEKDTYWLTGELIHVAADEIERLQADAIRWAKAREMLCYSFDGEHRTYYLKASHRESFQETIDRSLAKDDLPPQL